MWKRFFGFVLIIILAFTSIPISGLANGNVSNEESSEAEKNVFEESKVQIDNEIVANGTCGDNLTWTLNNKGVLKISGTGNMYGYNYYGKSGYAPWYDNRLDIVKVLINEDVKSIGKAAFYKCSNMTEISIPESVSYIGDYAFLECSSITNIVIPSRIAHICDGTFKDCSNLVNINIPDRVSFIGSHAFSGCSSLTNITLPKEVRFMKGYAFYHCSSLEKIVIPEYITDIGDKTFEGCSSLMEVTLPDKIYSIGERAFYRCSSLKEITIPSGVTAINNSTFWDCTNLSKVEFPESLTSIGDGAFVGCVGLTDVVIPQNVTSIGYTAFFNCSGLRSIKLPDGITRIGAEAFKYCSNLMDITIPESVTYIGSGAFYECTNLESIKLSSNLTAIEYETFKCCSALNSIIVPDLVTSIGNSAFTECGSLEKITLSEKLTSIGACAFSNCSKLSDIILPDSIASIGESAFFNCESLVDIILPAKLGSINMQVFQNCTGLKSVVIRNNVTSIEEKAFLNCSNLAEVKVSSNLTSIGSEAFADCGKLENIVLPDKIASIGDKAFINCSGLNDLVIPGGVVSIGTEVFSHCTSLKSVTICEGVTSIGRNAFKNCKSLEKVVIPDSVASIGDTAFYGCAALESVTIPDCLSYIAEGTFANCSNLTKVIIPYGVTKIREDAFFNCSSLEKIYFKGDCPGIKSSSFQNVKATVYYPDDDESWKNSWEKIVKNSDKSDWHGATVVAWIAWNPETGGLYGDGGFSEEDDENNSSEEFVIPVVPYFCMVNSNVFVFGTYSSSEDAGEEIKKVKWTSSDSSIAEVSLEHSTPNSEKSNFNLEIIGHKAGVVTITGVAEDGRTVSFDISVEPEMKIESQNMIITDESDIICSVYLDEADPVYLEEFISGVIFEITNTDNGAALVMDSHYEISEDGKSAKAVLSIKPIYDGTIKLRATSMNGQVVTAAVHTDTNNARPGTLEAEEQANGLAFYNEPYYSQTAETIRWTGSSYNQTEIKIRLKIKYDPLEDSDEYATINKVKFSLNNLDMFKIDEDEELLPNVQLLPGEIYTCYITLVKKGMFWKQIDKGTTQTGTINVEIEGDFPSMDISKKYSLELNVVNEELEETETSDEEQALDQEVSDDVENALNAFDDLSEEMALDARLGSYIGANQLEALKLVLYSEIAIVNMSQDEWTEAGFSEEVAEEIMDEYLGEWKPKVGTQVKDIPVSVIVESESHGNIQCDFVCHLSGFTLNGSTFAVSGNIETELTFIDEGNGTVKLLSGIINDCDMKKFTDAVWSISSSCIKKGYNSVLGNEVNAWITSLVNKGIDKIASMAAPYGLKKPVEKMLKQFYEKKIKSKLDTFEILCYPAKSVVVECPVDIYIYDSEGALVGSIENDEVTLSSDNMALWTVGDDKYIQLFGSNYKIEYQSTDKGSMDLTIYDQSDGDTNLRVCTFKGVPLEVGLEYTSYIDSTTLIPDSSSYNLISNREEIICPGSVKYMGLLANSQKENLDDLEESSGSDESESAGKPADINNSAGADETVDTDKFAKKDETVEADKSSDPQKASDSINDFETENPGTGDNSNLAFWGIVLIIALVGMAVVLSFKIRKEHRQ